MKYPSADVERSKGMDECSFCKGREALQKIMRIIEEELPETGASFYDDPITDLFNQADDACGTWRCYCEDDQPERYADADAIQKCPHCDPNNFATCPDVSCEYYTGER